MTLAALIAQIKAGEAVSVSWSIHPEIGPGWIGGERSVTIRVGDRVLAKSMDAQIRLGAVLVERGVIPAGLSDSVLAGEGTLRVEGGQLMLDYAWRDTPVYQYGTAGHAVIALIDL